MYLLCSYLFYLAVPRHSGFEIATLGYKYASF